MPRFPKTYVIVRGGSVETVTVTDIDTLLELRTELALLCHFGAGVTPAIIAAFEAKLNVLTSQNSDRTTAEYDDVEDMRSILMDAQASANALAAASIDADFPEIKGVLNMSTIENESEQFHQEAAEVIADAPVSDADALAEAFAEATTTEIPEADIGGEPVVDEVVTEVDTYEAEPGEAVAETDMQQAEACELVAESEGIVGGEQDVETVADALEKLADEAENELESIADDFADVSKEISDLSDTVHEAVGMKESPSDEVQNTTDPVEPIADSADQNPVESETADDKVEVLESAATDTSDDANSEGSFETMVQTGDVKEQDPFSTDELHADSPNEEPFDPFAAAEAEAANASAQSVGVVDSASTVTVPVTPTTSSSSTADWQSTGNLRGQLEEVKQNLIFQIDRLGEVLDHTAGVQEQVRKTASQAAEFRKAVDQAQAASQRFAAAQAESDKARSAYEQTQQRVAEARRAWEAAQCTATEAAKHVDANA